jgi:hypothetical protein
MPKLLPDHHLPSNPMSNDIVDRLRHADDGWSGDAFCISADTAEEAASEIERLRAVLRLSCGLATPPDRIRHHRQAQSRIRGCLSATRGLRGSSCGI